MKRVLRHGGLVVWVLLMCVPPVSAQVKTDALVKVFVNKNSID